MADDPREGLAHLTVDGREETFHAVFHDTYAVTLIGNFPVNARLIQAMMSHRRVISASWSPNRMIVSFRLRLSEEWHPCSSLIQE